jgi:hypothetical protein
LQQAALDDGPGHVMLNKDAGHAASTGSPLLLLHGGNVLTSTVMHAIWWGSEWSSASFAGDKISGMESFFHGYGRSDYADTVTEYDGADGAFATHNSSYGGSLYDSSEAPAHALSTADAVAEACKMTNDNPVANAIYFIYTSTGAGHVNYCAWHNHGSCANGAPVLVAYMPNLDGVAGCDPLDTWTTHSEGLAALASVTAHELSESITDPVQTGWYSASGNENGDECAWSFVGPVKLSNRTTWKLQGEWSNAAYNAGTGYANLSGQKGCIQGQ